MTDVGRASLLEELFLKGCTEVVMGLYHQLEYRDAVCEECRNVTPRQTDHRCYWEDRKELAREQMECAIYTLQRKPWQVFAAMRNVMRWQHPKYEAITGGDVLDFFEKRQASLPPLEMICSRRGWRNRILEEALKAQGYYSKKDAEGQWFMDKMDGTPSQAVTLVASTDGTPPLVFQDEQTQDVFY